MVSLANENSLGRHPDSSIQILDKVVSKEHCRIWRGESGWVLEDLESLNGTYVNGARLAGKRALENGDEFSLGATRARFEIEDSEAAAPATPEPADGLASPQAGEVRVTERNVGQFEPTGASAMPRITGRNAETSAMGASRVTVQPESRAIGTQIDVQGLGFRPYALVAHDAAQLAADYERLRLSHELSREICLERDLPTLLDKILASMFRFVRADRGAIFLMGEDGELQPSASLRRDGSQAPISVSSTIMNHVVQERAAVLTHDATMDFAGSKGKSMILNRITSAIVAPLLHEKEILGVLWLDSETLARFEDRDLEMVTAIAGQAAMFIEINILGRKVEQEIVNRERFSRLLSPNVAEKVLSGDMVIQRGGQRVRQCTVFNSDIRGFTPMSEGTQPETLVEMLNEYFELMVEVLFKYEGTLDKFMGDGIMALWGAPVRTADDAVRAVECALEQMEVLRGFNQARRAKNAPALEIGIGIHSGPVVAGYIGSSKALSYTVIGDTANTSARLCGAAGPGEILVSHETLRLLGTRFDHQELPPVQLKGKEKPFRCYAIQKSKFALSVAVAPPSSTSSRPPSSSRGRSGSER